MTPHPANMRKKRTWRTKRKKVAKRAALNSPSSLPSHLSPTAQVRQLAVALDRFVARLRKRRVAGATTYGDASFERPAAELVDEAMEELEDVCGWSLLLWVRLDRLHARVERVAERGGEDG